MSDFLRRLQQAREAEQAKKRMEEESRRRQQAEEAARAEAARQRAAAARRDVLRQFRRIVQAVGTEELMKDLGRFLGRMGTSGRVVPIDGSFAKHIRLPDGDVEEYLSYKYYAVGHALTYYRPRDTKDWASGAYVVFAGIVSDERGYVEIEPGTD